jgi:DNA-binding NarL/FixJ family response regulator
MTKSKPIWDGCTERQRDVLILLARHGWSNKRIAHELGTTELNVKGYLRRIYDRTKLRNRMALATAFIMEERHDDG